eukprot:TRINITY_DN398_c0_g2_i1.p1 TRINITY_DN398_c0_g2~~TRINITY_DN398_c0_g2_i1.p1  ORF type:complete len:616 (+),score=124.61 TRINITY_DN398_c0_g2_i1:12-1859(+)
MIPIPKHRSINVVNEIPLVGISSKSESKNKKDYFPFNISGLVSSTFVVVFLVTITMISGLFYTSTHEPVIEFEITSKETHLIKMNKFMYSQVDIVDKDGLLQTFVFSNEPNLISKEVVTHYDMFNLPRDHFKSWGRYSNTGTEFHIETSLTNSLTPESSRLNFKFCIVQGEKNYRKWLRTGVCNSEYHTFRSKLDLYYTVLRSDTYYFIIEPSDEDITDVTGEDVLSKKRYLIQKDNHSEDEEEVEIEAIEMDRETTEFISESNSIPNLSMLSRGIKVAEDDQEIVSDDNDIEDHITNETWSNRQIDLDKLDTNESEHLKDGIASNATDFYIVYGDILFTVKLTSFDTTYARDVYIGSFTKDINFRHKDEVLVFNNPSTTQTLQITCKLTYNSQLFVIIFVLIEFMMFIYWCCSAGYSLSAQKRRKREEKKLYPGISYDNLVYRKKKKKANIKVIIDPNNNSVPMSNEHSNNNQSTTTTTTITTTPSSINSVDNSVPLTSIVIDRPAQSPVTAPINTTPQSGPPAPTTTTTTTFLVPLLPQYVYTNPNSTPFTSSLTHPPRAHPPSSLLSGSTTSIPSISNSLLSSTPHSFSNYYLGFPPSSQYDYNSTFGDSIV